MSLTEFEHAIESEALRLVVRHWTQARGQRAMPGWDEIRPAALKAQLPIVWAWKFDRESREFTGRLAGARIETTFGKSFRGLNLKQIYSGRDLELAFARFHKVVSTPMFFRGKGLVFRALGRFDIGERVILPLASDGATGDGIIGATDFKSNTGIPSPEIVRAGEVEQWFAPD